MSWCSITLCSHILRLLLGVKSHHVFIALTCQNPLVLEALRDFLLASALNRLHGVATTTLYRYTSLLLHAISLLINGGRHPFGWSLIRPLFPPSLSRPFHVDGNIVVWRIVFFPAVAKSINVWRSCCPAAIYEINKSAINQLVDVFSKCAQLAI